MEPQGIHIVGPDGVRYQPGKPMRMFAGGVYLGQVEPVVLNHDGTEVHFGSFTATPVVQDDPRNVGAFLFYEACAHIAHCHPQIQLIHFASSRPMPALGDPAVQAGVRVATAVRIGAVDVRVTLMPSGLIAVSGTWIYNERNLQALDAALEEQRALYRETAIGRTAGPQPLVRWLGRLLPSLGRT